MARLVLLRHGESEWNRENLFTGWWDSPLTPLGESQAAEAGRLMDEHDVRADVVHTSLQTRAIRTVELALFGQGRSWIPVRRDWRLNERHYGDLTGRNKAETAELYGVDQVKVWRRSYDVPPPPITPENEHNPNGDERYAQVPPEEVPLAECLKDVVGRLLPYWDEVLAPDLRDGRTVLVGAHGNSLRALVKQLDEHQRHGHRRGQHPHRRTARVRARRRPAADRREARRGALSAQPRRDPCGSGGGGPPGGTRLTRAPGGTMAPTRPQEAVRCSDSTRRLERPRPWRWARPSWRVGAAPTAT